MRRLAVLSAFLIATVAASSWSAPHVRGCAFAVTPTAYEPMIDRQAMLAGLDLAGYNMIAPEDPFFGTPNVETGLRDSRRIAEEPYIPPTLLKAIGYIESHLAQGDWNTPFGAVGPALVSFDCGYGIMQITSGMTSPADGGQPSRQQALVATHYLYNIARGAAILVDKWNSAPQVRPIAGTDTDGDPTIMENWYFAVWSYNGFTGPGARRSNHPSDPRYAWPRTGFSCGPLDDGYGHSYGDYPYQELVYGCASRPPSVDGEPLWTPRELPYALPDLSDPRWAEPLSLDNWLPCASHAFDCAAMDMPTPLLWHNDPTLRPDDSVADYLLGAPMLVASRGSVYEPSTRVAISNAGTGILAWRARPSDSWIGLDKQGGVALGLDVPCLEGALCERSPVLTITLQEENPGVPGWVDIESLTNGEVWRITAETGRIHDVDCDGSVNAIDAVLILQLEAGLADALPCQENADVNDDGLINSIDASIILQFDAGLLDTLAPTPTTGPTPMSAPPPALTPTPTAGG